MVTSLCIEASYRSLCVQPIDPLPVLLDYSEEEKRICQLQNDFVARLRKSPYYVVEAVKSNGQCSHPAKVNRVDTWFQSSNDTQTNIVNYQHPSRHSKRATFMLLSFLRRYSRIISTPRKNGRVRLCLPSYTSVLKSHMYISAEQSQIHSSKSG